MTETGKETIERVLGAHRSAFERLAQTMTAGLDDAAELACATIARGNQALIFGNGGSASMAQHFAAELVGRYERDRRALPAIALTTDTSILTAVANDYSFDQIFARQVEALAQPGDLLWAMTTSGNSPNVLAALRLGKSLGCKALALTGRDGGAASGLAELTDVNLIVDEQNTARIQELHLLIGHLLCELVEARCG